MNQKTKIIQNIEGYNISISGRHVQVTESMKDYAMEKISKIERFSPRLIDVVVTMDIQKLDHRVDIVLRFDNIKVKSHAASTDMYASIDAAVDKLQNQIRRYKNKIQDHHARGLKAVDMIVNVVHPHLEDAVNEVNMEIEEENDKHMIESYRPHQVVAQETIPLKFLSIDEAIMKMELSQDAFLVYKDEVNRMLKVIYRRNDGNYGVIEPEA
jgi:putative sigma-54 modulation protein